MWTPHTLPAGCGSAILNVACRAGRQWCAALCVLPLITAMDSPSLRLQSCSNSSLRWRPWQGYISLLFAPVILTLTRWPSYMNLTCILWRCTRRPETNYLGQDFRKLSYYKHTDIQTDRQTDTERGNRKSINTSLLASIQHKIISE